MSDLRFEIEIETMVRRVKNLMERGDILEAQLSAALKENEEQARLLGRGANAELALMAKIEHLQIIDKYRTSPTPWLVDRLSKLERVKVAAEYYIKIDGDHDSNKIWGDRCGLRDALAAANRI